MDIDTKVQEKITSIQGEPGSYGRLRVRRVFATGGGSRTGESFVSAFAEQGAKLAFADIDVDASFAKSLR